MNITEMRYKISLDGRCSHPSSYLIDETKHVLLMLLKQRFLHRVSAISRPVHTYKQRVESKRKFPSQSVSSYLFSF